MFLEHIMKILNVSSERNVDITVARDMIMNDDNISLKDIRPAYKFISDYYDEVTKCRSLKMDDKLKELVGAYEKNDTELFNKIREDIKNL